MDRTDSSSKWTRFILFTMFPSCSVWAQVKVLKLLGLECLVLSQPGTFLILALGMVGIMLI